ncbi:MAG: hypothetical protein ACI9J3_000440 [Parvicellaceae bacterium]|jgi:hypothetical protein
MKNYIYASLLLFVAAFLINPSYGQKTHSGWYECGDAMAIDTNLFAVDTGKTYFYFDTELAATKLRSKGFTWTSDSLADYFTAYFINTSDSTFITTLQDGSIVMIQEALDENNEWQPIEYWVHSGCGNSYFEALKLEPGQYSMVPIRKHTGDYTTKARLKMPVGKKIYYSRTFNVILIRVYLKEKKDKYMGSYLEGLQSILKRNRNFIL